MTKEVVISAYTRNYNWVYNLNENVKVTVYNKNIETLKEGETYLPNVGRDVHTFFYHIVNNYNNLSDYTFFSQDDPFDHVKNYIEIINGDSDIWNNCSLQKSEDCWFFNTLWINSLTGNPVTLVSDRYGQPNSGRPLDIYNVWRRLFNSEMIDHLVFTPGGHFCISKKGIKSRPIEFYKTILNILENEEDSPWIIERLEPYIFIDIMKPDNMRKIYLSIPHTGHEELSLKLIEEVSNELIQNGHFVFSPIRKVCESLKFKFNSVIPINYKEINELLISEFMNWCDEVIVINFNQQALENSKGVQIELKYAEDIGRKIKYINKL